MVKTPHVIKTTRVYKVIQKRSQCERRRPRSAHWGIMTKQAEEVNPACRSKRGSMSQKRITLQKSRH